MKYLIVGLGNIGSEYDGTRHNIGFDVLDYLAEENNGKWKTESMGDLCEIKHKGRTLCLLKPSTYMNRSGKAINYWMTKKKIKRDKILVVVDDLHMTLGKLRLRGKGSDGGHNGLKDIQQVLGGTNYPRLKFGIGNDFHSGQQVNFVLGKWDDKEMDIVNKTIKKSAEAIKSFTSIGIKFTMERFNG
ncbi:MAG: aminoacyl-tRNA hydrolase [Saprospiraceae bacterium]|nr:aminoacyl-tRNA hydrolase [Saprospiraceae bacterium]